MYLSNNEVKYLFLHLFLVTSYMFVYIFAYFLIFFSIFVGSSLGIIAVSICKYVSLVLKLETRYHLLYKSMVCFLTLSLYLWIHLLVFFIRLFFSQIFHPSNVLDSGWLVDILDPFRIFYGRLMVYVVSGHSIVSVNLYSDSMN